MRLGLANAGDLLQTSAIGGTAVWATQDLHDAAAKLYKHLHAKNGNGDEKK